jgi:hypothetical protein
MQKNPLGYLIQKAREWRHIRLLRKLVEWNNSDCPWQGGGILRTVEDCRAGRSALQEDVFTRAKRKGHNLPSVSFLSLLILYTCVLIFPSSSHSFT